MTFAKKIRSDADSTGKTLPVADLFAPIDHVLIAGGDRRVSLSHPAHRNVYGCTPHPDSGRIDFASSTASTISGEAYARAIAARDAFLSDMVTRGSVGALDAAIESQREALKRTLDIEDSGVDIVFCASGTDAQIKALFLAKSLLGVPLTSVIVGADQTGSGTVHTAYGRHFSDLTASGRAVVEGQPIAGLADDVRSLRVPFAASDGGFRTAEEMDKAVLAAVAETADQDGAVLLQAMDSSKFGWRAPSDACLNIIARRWPGQVQVVIDACQMRLTRARLKNLLARNCIVLITGSKFFTGPAFSGALLVSKSLGASAIAAAPEGLGAYSSCFDWPADWAVREKFAARPNWGQWLRWEAALEEMRLYFAVPEYFRDQAQAQLVAHARKLFCASPGLALLPQDGETIFAFVPHRNGIALSPADCGKLHAALGRDCSIPGGEDSHLSALCQIGQPVTLDQDRAALRIALSARTIRNCWADDPAEADARIAAEAAKLSALVEKLNFLLRHFDAVAP